MSESYSIPEKYFDDLQEFKFIKYATKIKIKRSLNKKWKQNIIRQIRKIFVYLQQQPQFQQSYQQKPLPFCQQHGQEIYAVCFNSACNQSKLVCFNCITHKHHFGHPDSLKKFSDLEGILNSELDDMLKEVLFEYSKLKLGIKNKFNLPKEEINQISNNNFSQYLLNIIQFEQQSANIIKLMKEYCKDFTIKPKNQVIELELDQLNYLEISKENQENKLYHEFKANFQQADVEFFVDMLPIANSYLTKTLNQLDLNQENITIAAKVRKAACNCVLNFNLNNIMLKTTNTTYANFTFFIKNLKKLWQKYFQQFKSQLGFKFFFPIICFFDKIFLF